MADITKVNPQVVDLINTVQAATMGPQVVKTSGAGKAYQAVAQSTAIAVQDAADTLRNMSTIATTAIGVAMAQYLATKDKDYLKAIDEAQTVMTNATQNFTNIGAAAGEILRGFPSG
jgi:hypothetical protein